MSKKHHRHEAKPAKELDKKNVRVIALAAVMGLSMSIAVAQPGSGRGPGAVPGPMAEGLAASAPRMGMGPGGGRGARWGSCCCAVLLPALNPRRWPRSPA